MYKNIVALTAVLLVSGCNSLVHRPINAESQANIQKQSVTYAQRDKSQFIVFSTKSVSFGVLGGLVAESDGNKIITEHNISDPAEAISLGLIKELEHIHEMNFVSPGDKLDTANESQVTANINDPAKYMIDVQTVNWGAFYYPTDWTHYRTLYIAKARLIDIEKNLVLAESFCEAPEEDSQGAPTYDELFGNGATLFKNKMNTISEQCINSIKTQMFTATS